MKTGQTVWAIAPRTKKLTDGKAYVIKWISCGGYLAVVNDEGKTKPYAVDNFDICSPL